MHHLYKSLLPSIFLLVTAWSNDAAAQAKIEKLLAHETLKDSQVWIAPKIKNTKLQTIRVVVWFESQFLGDGLAYQRRAKEFAQSNRLKLREQTIASLKHFSHESHKKAESDIRNLVKQGTIQDVKKHWIVNGFSCTIDTKNVDQLTKIKGVKKVFYKQISSPKNTKKNQVPHVITTPKRSKKLITDKLPWYVAKLRADKVWTELGITGEGTLNVIHDSSFIITPSLASNIYINSGEIPNNGLDDDDNGLIDDFHGYDFIRKTAVLTAKPLRGDKSDKKKLHGTNCAQIVCGVAAENGAPQFGIAPKARWAGVIAKHEIESAVEWAIEQRADTYSMSFTKSDLGETRSHWRKLMEHGAFCGVYFVSGAGNDGQKAKIPVQMRVPQSIPYAVFAAAGVQRDLSKAPFSSRGPVVWNTDHYQDGTVSKPEVCAFNSKLPLLMPDGSVRKDQLNGNSFAGPMFCGTISLMLSADPELLPWDLRDIITATAKDVGPAGIDYETGHGLINCYKAVQEVIRRKKLRSK